MGSRSVAPVCLACMMVASLLSVGGAPPAEGAGGSFGGGSGTPADPYVIEDVEDLQNMSLDRTAYYVLGNDIDASATRGWDSGAGFQPVGDAGYLFTGRLDGAGHAVRSLFIYRPTAIHVGLLGYVGTPGSVRDLALVGSNVTGTHWVGALVGYNEGKVTGCSASGDVNGSARVGGLVGWNADAGTVSGSRASGNVTGHYTNVGGLVGYDRGTVSGCRADVRVRGLNDYVGGLVGTVADGTVSDSHATGDVSGLYCVGGLAGSFSHATVSDCSASGTVSGGGGVGGLAGTSMFITVSVSYASGGVSATSVEAGGLLGVNGGTDPTDQADVSDCYATGDVAAAGDHIGGLVGHNRGTVARCHSAGRVEGAGASGGLVGTDEGGLVEDSFWDLEASGQDASAGGTGLPTAGMRAFGTFAAAGWDLAYVWFIVENVTYPALRWQDAASPTAEAGPDQAVALGADGTVAVAFDGSGSADDFGHLNCTWSFDDHGAPVVLHGAAAGHAFSAPGSYGVTLTVRDATGHVATDALRVDVSDVTPPVADAGPDLTVDQWTMVTFDGSGSSDNVGVVNLTWDFTDRTPVTLHGVRPGHRFDDAGVFAVTLNVTDAAGRWGTDSMTVTVNDTTPPAADAGPDRTVPVGSAVALNGSLSTDNVAVANHSWALTYDGGPRALQGAVVTFTFDAAGVYEVLLTVTDEAGNRGNDTVVITVVGTGRVNGTVLGKDGKPVEGATVTITTADGGTNSTTTAADGSFALDAHHGPFTWKVGKKGYKEVSGSSSVEPMGSTELDLSERPLVREDRDGPGAGAAAILTSMALAAIAAAASRGRAQGPGRPRDALGDRP